MLFVVDRTGADPTLVGGGELALDIDVDVIETLSDIASLVGVPGRSSRETEARLGWREGGKCGGNIDVTEDGVLLPVAGISVLGVEVSRKVFGAVLSSGD
jgi:xanthine/CO dehydrogenase XdhC/CoxF family maturation factor